MYVHCCLCSLIYLLMFCPLHLSQFCLYHNQLYAPVVSDMAVLSTPYGDCRCGILSLYVRMVLTSDVSTPVCSPLLLTSGCSLDFYATYPRAYAFPPDGSSAAVCSLSVRELDLVRWLQMTSGCVLVC